MKFTKIMMETSNFHTLRNQKTLHNYNQLRIDQRIQKKRF